MFAHAWALAGSGSVHMPGLSHSAYNTIGYPSAQRLSALLKHIVSLLLLERGFYCKFAHDLIWLLVAETLKRAGKWHLWHPLDLATILISH